MMWIAVAHFSALHCICMVGVTRLVLRLRMYEMIFICTFGMCVVTVRHAQHNTRHCWLRHVQLMVLFWTHLVVAALLVDRELEIWPDLYVARRL
jgi:hypothetical protein